MSITKNNELKERRTVKPNALRSIIALALASLMALPVGMFAVGSISNDNIILDFNVDIACVDNQSMVQAGDSHTYQIEVTNTGTEADKILLTIDNPTGWAAHFNQNPISDSVPGPATITSARTVNGYHTFPEIEAELSIIAANHSDICQLFSIGQSWESRELWVMKVSDNPTVNESEPELFINGGIHAREWIADEVPLYYLHWLVDNYGVDPQATWLIDNRQIFIAPCVNPDGLVYCQNVADWRKNRRNNGDGTYGVDLNRNWDGSCNGDPNGGWGQGSGVSHTPGAETYCGPSAFSEPETKAMRDFILAHDFQIMITYHSYAEEVYWPWGYNTAVQTPTDSYQSSIAGELAAVNGYTPMQSAASYFTTGDTDDWTYGYNWYTLGKECYPFTIELGSSFQPPQSQITPICQLNLGVNLLASEVADNLHQDSPIITHTELPDTMDITGPYVVNAEITTPNGLQLDATKIFWRVAPQPWNEVIMTNVGGNSWQANIPGQPDGSWVNYYIETTDINSHTSTSPKYAPYVYHDFFVGNDVTEYAVTLDAFETRIVNFTVQAPVFALPNEFAAISIIGTSQNDSLKTDSVETITTVMPALLLVNDGNAVFTNYQAAVEACGYQYDIGTPATDLSTYKIVLWATDGGNTISASEQAALITFLDNGGSLYINGEDIGYDLGTSGTGESAGFYRDHLHADYIADDSNGATMNGIPGDEITDGMTGFQVSGSYPSSINPYDGMASSIFTYNTAGNAGIKVDTGTYRLVYLACEYFEGSDPFSNKCNLMFRILNWLMPQPKMHDIETTSIDSHINGNTYPPGAKDVKATVTNLGQANESSFNARCVITELQSGGTPQTFITQDFTSATFPPTGWNVQTIPTTGIWSRQTTANAGGTSPEARFMYGSSGTGTSRIYAGPIDTTGMTSLDLQWQNMIDDDTGSAGVACKVQTSTDASTWHDTSWIWDDTVTPGNMAAGLQSTNLNNADVGSSTFYLSWTVTGNSYRMNYWYIDNVLLEYAPAISEVEVYNETRATTGILDYGSSQQLTWNYDFPNEYQYRIDVYSELPTDERANNNKISIVISIEGTLTQFNIPVLPTPGWNFISFPLALSGSPDIVLSDIAGDGTTTWDAAKWYDATDKTDPWKTYRGGAPNNDLDMINNCMGIWVHVTNGGDNYITIEGFTPTSTAIQLYTGWNLVGYPSATAQTASASLPAQADMISLFQAASPYVSDTADLGSVTLAQGNGYWVHVTADCLWSVDY